MTIDARLNSLGLRHHDLEALIADEMRHPSHDELRISDLKRQKLAIKDEIERLKTDTPH